MKKLLITTALLLSLTGTALAANGITERFYKFSAGDSGAISEVNYYLEKGATVKFLQSTARGNDTVLITMVIEIPSDVYTNENYHKRK